jgi:predicted dehydrogenase
MLATMHLNWLSPVKVRQIIVGGDKRMVVFDDMQTVEKVKLFDCGAICTDTEGIHEQLVQYRTGDMISPRIRNDEALSVGTRHFLDCIAGKASPITGGRQALDVLRMLDAADRSLQRDGEWIRL